MPRQAFPYVITTPPAGDPLFVSLADARAYLRLDADDPTDAELTAFIQAAQAAVERFTKLTLFDTTFTTKRDVFTSEIQLRRAPLQSVTSITQLVSDSPVTVDASTYKAIDEDVNNWGSIVLKAGQLWPTDQDIERRTIEIAFVAGFGPDETTLPPDLITGALRVLADLIENRGDCSCAGAMATMSPAAMALLGPFKIMEV